MADKPLLMQRLPPHLKRHVLEETKLLRYPLRIAVLPELLFKTRWLERDLRETPIQWDWPLYKIKYMLYTTSDPNKVWVIWCKAYQSIHLL